MPPCDIAPEPDDGNTIRTMVQDYFQGLHQGDATRLAALFHEDCVLKSPGSRRDLQRWLFDVANRPVPEAIGHTWAYRVVWLEVEGAQAMVKVDCPLPHGRYTDYLGFLHEGGHWKIVQKMYAHHPEAADADTQD